MALKITHVDKAKEVEGVWTDYLGVSLCIARQNNKKFLAELKRLAAEEGRRPFHKLPKTKRERIVLKALSTHILVDWDDFELGGVAVDYTPENALELLENDEECLNFVSNFAMNTANFLEETEKEVGEE